MLPSPLPQRLCAAGVWKPSIATLYPPLIGKVPQPAKVSAPIDVKLSAIPLDADGNIDTKKDAQLTITPPSDITGIASYQVTVVSGGSPLSPTYTIAAGSTTCTFHCLC